MSKTTFYAPHDASERLLASGRPLTPGATFQLTSDEMKDTHNKRLIEEGKILEVPTAKEQK